LATGIGKLKPNVIHLIIKIYLGCHYDYDEHYDYYYNYYYY